MISNEKAVTETMSSGQRIISDERWPELFTALGARVKEFTILHEVTQMAVESLGLNEVSQVFVGRVSDLMEVDVAAICLADEQDGTMVTAAHGDVSSKFLDKLKEQPVSYSVTDRLALSGAPVIIEDVFRYPLLVDVSVREEGLRSVAATPLKSNGKVIGTLLVGSRDLRNFNSEDIQLLAILGEGVGPVLKNAQLYNALRRKVRQLAAYNDELVSRQQELMEKTREAQEANQLKSEFLSRMSHELRTPLNSVIGFSELLVDQVPGPVNDEQKQCLNDILASGEHLLQLVNEVLDLSKIESGKAELRQRNISMTDVIESVKHTMRPILTPRNQHLDVKVVEESSQVYADEDRLRQVLLNLLSNASKFSPDGSEITIEAVKKGDWCEISVIDRGVGIKREEQRMIFEPLYHSESSLRDENSTTGLGLAIVKQIVEKHGGRVWLESESGRGSRFNFTLPLAVA